MSSLESLGVKLTQLTEGTTLLQFIFVTGQYYIPVSYTHLTLPTIYSV